MKRPHLMVVAGGTGGHVFPALAVARALQAKGHDVQWLGTPAGMEADIVPKADIVLHTLNVKGFRGKKLVSKLLAPWHLLCSVISAIGVVWRVKPDAVIGFGGYVAAPGGIAAWALRKPLIIHEQNAIAGTTNRLLARFTRHRLQAFPGALTKATTVGNPIRKDLLEAAVEPRSDIDNLRILVVGGSLGAMALNRVVPQALGHLQGESLEVIHQTGAKHFDSVKNMYSGLPITAEVKPFIEDMLAAYQWADLVICRAGAMTVSEVATMAKAAIFVPFPHAIDDHQTANARYLADQQAAYLMPENTLTDETLAQAIKGLLDDKSTLAGLQNNAKQLAHNDATTTVVTICEDTARG